MSRRKKKQKLKLEETAGEEDSMCEITRSSGSDTAEETLRAPSLYLVVGHQVVKPAYSIFKVDPYADSGGDSTPVRIPHHLARLKSMHSMCFVPVRSKSRRWIVGVSGSTTKNPYGPETIVFDTETHAVIKGPKPGSTKRHPILFPVGDRVYALSRNPSFNGLVDDAFNGQIDFLPWFEVLDLSQSQVVDGCLTGCHWKPLPRPPCFPWDLTPYQYSRVLSALQDHCTVTSYAAVGSHILVSVTAGQPGTHVFDTETERWATLDDKNDLPFIKGAIPHGPGLFLAKSRATKVITAYKISVVAGPSPSLSVVEIPVVSELEDDKGVACTNNFLSLGIDRGFCSLSSWSAETRLGYPPCRHAHIRVRAYVTDDFAGKCLVVSKQCMQLYRIRDSIRLLDEPCLAAVISI